MDHNGPSDIPLDPRPADWTVQPVFHLFERVARQQAGAPAIIDPDARLTYGQVHAAVRALARRIDRETQADGAIGVLLPAGVGYPVAVLACLLARRPCVLLDRSFPAARNAAIMRDACLAGVITDADVEATATVPVGVTCIALTLTAIEPAEGPVECVADDPDRPAFVIYTSGSTGQPKGLVQSQRTILQRIGQLIDSKHLGPADRFLSLASPCAIDGLFDSLAALLSGAALLTIDLRRSGLRQALHFAQDQRASILLGLPGVLRALAEDPEAAVALSTLRVVRTSGDALLHADLKLIRSRLPADCHFLSVFGATEAGAMLQWFIPPDAAPAGARMQAGYPLPGYRLAIIDEHDAPVPPGAVGELVVSSRYTAWGTWQDGRCVQGRLPPDPADPSSRILRTGDLAQQRPDGLFVLLGRRDRQIKIGGQRIEPAEIEATLRRLPGVASAVVLPQRDGAEVRLLAFVVPVARTDAGLADALRGMLRSELPVHMRPSRIILVDAIPLLPGGKVDAEALMTIATGAPAGVPAVAAPADARSRLTLAGARTRLTLANILQRCLDRAGKSIERRQRPSG